MRNMKYTIPFGIALVCAMLFAACDTAVESAKTLMPAENSYGRITISLEDGEAAERMERTILPPAVFDKYVYTFTKAGETAEVEKEPDNDGFFTLEIGDYTVKVQAYIGAKEPYTLAASGVSPQFSVGPGSNDTVRVPLSEAAAGQGNFSYTITYPTGATAKITLQKWPDLDDITLNPVNVSSGDGKTQTLQLEAGSYLLIVLLSKDERYAGISEAIHIKTSLSTVYANNFADDDLLLTPTPVSSDFTITGIGTFTYDGSSREVTIAPKTGKSTGAITILYNGTDTAPTTPGDYAVTFNVDEAKGWLAAQGLPAGTITITKLASTVNVLPTAAAITYGAALSTSALSGGEGTPAGGTFAWTNGWTIPTVSNNGYSVTYTPVDTNYGAVTVLGVPITVYKANGATVSAPTLLTVTSTSIIVNESTAPGTGQAIEYAKNTVNTVPSSSSWQNSATFFALNPGTTYYIFARAKENSNYNTGTASASLTVKTPLASVTVTFNINGGTGTTPATMEAESGTNITLPGGSGFSRTGFTFDGWNTNTSGTGTNYNGGASYTASANITLYAKWNNNPYYYTDGLEFQIINSDTEFRVRKGTVTSGEVIIPPQYFHAPTSKYLPVTEIGSSDDDGYYYSYNGAFYNTGITSVVIPSTVKTINSSAFYNCASLTTVTFANNSQLKSINGYAFYGCTRLTGITIPASVTSIGYQTFSGCTNLTSIAIPANVTSIDSYAFMDCTNLATVTFASGSQLQSISVGMFYGCTKLNDIIIPSNVMFIGSNRNEGNDGAFKGCTSLTSITIPAYITSIGSQTFSGCTNLTSVTFASGSQLKSIYSSAFSNCTRLTGITIPTSVTYIGDYTFSGCTSLTSIIIPANVTYIWDGMFYGCTNLTTVSMTGVTEIRSYAFYNVNSLTNITIGAECNIYSGSQSTRFNAFKTVYDNSGRYAGTYTWDGSSWKWGS